MVDTNTVAPVRRDNGPDGQLITKVVKWPCTECGCQNYIGSTYQLECARSSCGHDMIHHYSVEEEADTARAAVSKTTLQTTASPTMQRRTITFGRLTGSPFSPQIPLSVGLRGNQLLDAIIINGDHHGGPGGNASTVEALGSDDYWSEVEIRAGNFVDYLRLTSQTGRQVGAGGGGGSGGVFSDLRVVAIGGRSGVVVDQLSIDLVQGYRPSAVVERAVDVVLDLQPGGATIERYTDETTRTFHSYQVVTQQVMSLDVNVSAEIEFIGSFGTKTGLSLTRTSTILQETTRELKTGEKITQVIDADAAAFLIGKVDILRDSDGQGWMLPTTDADWVVLDEDSFSNLVGAYDLTGGTTVQTGLRTERVNGFLRLRSAN